MNPCWFSKYVEVGWKPAPLLWLMCCLIAAMALLSPSTASAQDRLYMRVSTPQQAVIPGSSGDPHRRDWIEILQATLKPKGLGSSDLSLIVDKSFDLSSPLLQKTMRTGGELTEVIIEVDAADGTTRARLKLGRGSRITSIIVPEQSGNAIEEISISYKSLDEFWMTPQKTGPNGFQFPPSQDRGFLRVDGITGSSTDPRRRNFIDIQEAHLNATSPTNPKTQQSISRGNVPCVRIVRLPDAASPQLQKAWSTGELLKNVVVEFSRPDNTGSFQLYERMTLGGDVRVVRLDTVTVNGKTEDVVWLSYQLMRVEALQGSRTTEYEWNAGNAGT